jgi:hypothetical protein
LPHGRYTIFVDYDPPDAVRRFQLVGVHGRSWPDWSQIPVQAGEVSAPLVQEELIGGTYRLLIDTTTQTCSWSVQVVLNTPLSRAKPPAPWHSPSQAPEPVTVRSGEPGTFQVLQTGRYLVDWRIGLASERRSPIQRYSLRLRAADGHEIEMGQAADRHDHRIDGAFLGAGIWTVDMQTSADWELTITPFLGPLGGGAVGF